MTKTIKRHAGGEPLPSADWNDIASSVEVVWPNAARARIVGTGPSTSPIAIIPPMIDITEPPYNCVGDATTDNTVGMQLAFDDADATNKAVFIPPTSMILGYLTGTINYKMQSIIGTNKTLCRILGKPGQDVLHVDASVGQFYRQAGIISNITILVNNTVDATATFPWRIGCNGLAVGNAGYAVDWNDRTTPSPPMAIDWVYQNLEIKGVNTDAVTTTAGGLNKTIGIYAQSNHFSQCYFNNINIGYLVHGWADHWPTINTTSGTNGRDHCIVDNIHFIRNSYQWRQVNWGIFDIANVIFHGGSVIGAWEMMGVTTSSAANFQSGHVTSVELAGATTYGLVTDTSVRDIQFDSVSIAGAPVDTFNGSACWFRSYSTTPTSSPNPRWIIAGNRNVIELSGIGTNTTDDYKWNRIEDRGAGNQIFINGLLGTSSDKPHRRESVTQDGRLGHMRDNVSGQLGIVTPYPFVSGNDFLINPREIITGSSHVLNTDYSYIIDGTADFGRYVRRLNTGSATVSIVNNQVNGLDSFRIGKFLPPTKVRVYVKCKLGTAGTITWNVRSNSVVKGTLTAAAIGTAWTLISWEADFTGEADGNALQLDTAAVAGGGALPLDIAWVLFRPWAQDWPVVRQSVSADNGNADKTLVFGDTEVQRWATVLTVNRAVTLPTGSTVPSNYKFRIIREAGATGAFNLTVNPGAIKVIATAGNWVDVQYDGTNWRVTASGAL